MITKQSGLRLAKRLDEVGFSDIVQIRNKVMELRAEGVEVHSLHGGEPFFETPPDIKYAAIQALVENQTHYAPSSGVLPLRKALVELPAKLHLDAAKALAQPRIALLQGFLEELDQEAHGALC